MIFWGALLELIMYRNMLQDLTERRYKNEASIRDLKSKLSSVEEENQLVKQDVQNLRKQNASLGMGTLY